MTQRAAIYARYSSDLQSPTSIEDQIRICREKARERGFIVAEEHVYTDAAMSGAALLNRPSIVALIDAAGRGCFDVVIAEAQDRLSRDMEDVAGLFKRLTYAGVRIFTLAEGEISALHIGLKGAMNALFLEDMKKKVRRGQRGQVERGRAAGGLSYGYRVLHRFGPDGKPENGLREIDPDQAAIIRRVFALVIDGKSPRAIAGLFNAEGVKPPRGRWWNASTINGNPGRGNGILHNELYIGQLIYNRQTHVYDPETGRRLARFNPPEAWTRVAAPELRIIDQATWDAVHASRRRELSSPAPESGEGRGGGMHTRLARARAARRPKHLLSGLLRCGACGGAYVVVGKGVVGCANRKERKTCDNTRTARIDRLEERVLANLREHLLAPAVVAEAIRAYRAEMEVVLSQAGQRRAEREKRLARLEGQIERVVTAIADGTDTPALRARMVEMESERAEIQRQAKIEARPAAVQLHPEAAEMYAGMVADLAAALNRPDTAADALKILRRLIAAITLYPGPRKGELEAELTANPEEIYQAVVGATGTAAARPPLLLNATRFLVATPRGFVQNLPTFSIRFWL